MSSIYDPTTGATYSELSTTVTFSGSGSQADPLFRVTGAVRVYKLWGIVTSAIGSNHTAGQWVLNDQTAVTSITANTGALSSFVAGSLLKKTALAATVFTARNANVGSVGEPSAANSDIPSMFDVVAKATANTDIEYRYTTNNSSGGAVQFFIQYDPLSADGAVAVAPAGGGGGD
jgi:hypothetical protein